MTPGERGRLIGIARRPAPRAPMEIVAEALVMAGAGLDGDHKGAKFPGRGITILAREDWDRALTELGDLAGPDLFGCAGEPLPWTARRANLLVEGLRLPRAKGAIIAIGDIRLEVTAQTYPCRRMEATRPGLLKALAEDWRGGVTCRVVVGGGLRVGDHVEVVADPGGGPGRGLDARPGRLPG